MPEASHPFLRGPRAPRVSSARAPRSGSAPSGWGASQRPARPRRTPRPALCVCTRWLPGSPLHRARAPGARGAGPGGPGVQGTRKRGRKRALGAPPGGPGGRATARPAPRFRGRPLPGRATPAPRNHREARVPRAAAGDQVRRGPPGVAGAPAGGSVARRPHVARAPAACPPRVAGPGRAQRAPRVGNRGPGPRNSNNASH